MGYSKLKTRMYTYKSDIFTSDPEKLKQKDFEWQI